MPSLNTMLHVDMLRTWKKRRGLLTRAKDAARAFRGEGDLYGLEWGDPERDAPLVYVKHHFLEPYLSAQSTVLEIGPGGGRWTRYLLAARLLYVVDYHQELLKELERNFARPNLVPIRNNGSDFPGVPPKSVDFAFSFGVFVHLELDTIEGYLASLRDVMKPGANVVLQYADETKPMGRGNPTFSKNSPEKMRALVKSHGYDILEEDLGTMWHSSIVRFSLPGG